MKTGSWFCIQYLMFNLVWMKGSIFSSNSSLLPAKIPWRHWDFWFSSSYNKFISTSLNLITFCLKYLQWFLFSAFFCKWHMGVSILTFWKGSWDIKNNQLCINRRFGKTNYHTMKLLTGLYFLSWSSLVFL